MQCEEIGNVDWTRAIIQTTKDTRATCYKLGGLLQQALHYELVTTAFVDACLTNPKFGDEKKQCVANGYLFWRFNSEAKETLLAYSKEGVERKDVLCVRKVSLEVLLSSFQPKALALLVSSLNTSYLRELMYVEAPIFRRLAPHVLKEREKGSWKDLEFVIGEARGCAINKIFRIATKKELRKWTSGSLRTPLLSFAPHFCPKEHVSEEVYIQRIARKIDLIDLERVWNIIEKLWPDSRLKDEGSLGQAFLAGLRERVACVEEETFIARVDKVVNERLYAKIDVLAKRLLSLVIGPYTPFLTYEK